MTSIFVALKALAAWASRALRRLGAPGRAAHSPNAPGHGITWEMIERQLLDDISALPHPSGLDGDPVEGALPAKADESLGAGAGGGDGLRGGRRSP